MPATVRNLVGRIVFRPAALRAVLRSAGPTWLAIIGLVMAFAIGALIGWMTEIWIPSDGRLLENSILYGGTLLELGGLVLVAKGLSDVRRLFGRPSIIERTLEWFGAFRAAFQPPSPITLNAASAIAIGSEANAVITRGPRPNATLEARVADLEAEIATLRLTQSQHAKVTRTEIRRLDRALHAEAEARSADDSKAKATVEEFAVGGLYLETVGVVWLGVGILAGNIPTLLATLVTRAL